MVHSNDRKNFQTCLVDLRCIAISITKDIRDGKIDRKYKVYYDLNVYETMIVMLFALQISPQTIEMIRVITAIPPYDSSQRLLPI